MDSHVSVKEGISVQREVLSPKQNIILLTIYLLTLSQV